MGGIWLLAVFEICGILTADALFREKSGLIRLWLGLCLGLAELMVLPAAFAFALRFTMAAQLCALAAAALLTAAALFGQRGVGRREGGFCGDMPAKLCLILIPLIVLGAYLQYTHTLRAAADGSLHVGQSTYGDLSLHLGIATSLRGAAFPPDYSLLPGTRLGYPFLADSMVTSLLLAGGSLTGSYILTGTLMLALVYTGFLILSWEMTHRTAAVVLAFLLLEFNGGLGFAYVLDGAFRDPTALREVFTGFYRTPTNMTDQNIRWVNLLCDMLIPQRTFLCGWMMLIPGLWLLREVLRDERRSRFILLGIWAGLMPMMHTHSFVALALISAGGLAHTALCIPSPEKGRTLKGLLCYAAVAAALALPQMLVWTVPQTVGGGSLNFRFNWVNNTGSGTLIDGYFWFWIKNVGLVYLMLIPAALSFARSSRERALSWGALLVYITAELIQFQPNVYDNNKLFYAAYLIMLPPVALWMVNLWTLLEPVRGRAIFAGAVLLACTTSGALTIGREVVSDYQLFGRCEVEAASYLSAHRDTDTVVLTGSQHNNAPAALSGCRIVCGTPSFLYFHGLDYTVQQQDMITMFEAPGENAALFAQYGVDYVYISSNERADFDVDEAYFEENGTLVFESVNDFGAVEIRIFALSESAKAAAEGENA